MHGNLDFHMERWRPGPHLSIRPAQNGGMNPRENIRAFRPAPANRSGRLTAVEIEEHLSRLDTIIPIPHDIDSRIQTLHEDRFIGGRMGLTYKEIADVERVRPETVRRSVWCRLKISIQCPDWRKCNSTKPLAPWINSRTPFFRHSPTYSSTTTHRPKRPAC